MMGEMARIIPITETVILFKALLETVAMVCFSNLRNSDKVKTSDFVDATGLVVSFPFEFII